MQYMYGGSRLSDVQIKLIQVCNLKHRNYLYWFSTTPSPSPYLLYKYYCETEQLIVSGGHFIANRQN